MNDILSYESIVKMTLSDLRQKRLDMQLSQADVAEFLDVSVGTIKRWESFQCFPSSKNLKNIRYFINATSDDIYKLLKF